jgi:predicted lipoprotein with Yx(FWY)xxD motif
MVTSSSRGQILVDGSGRTLYLWEVDKTAKSNCYDGCRNAWPPVVTTGKPVAGTGVDANLLGTSVRSDGQLEVVYNGHPLYYFIADKKAGDTTGQGINNSAAPGTSSPRPATRSTTASRLMKKGAGALAASLRAGLAFGPSPTLFHQPARATSGRPGGCPSPPGLLVTSRD